MSKAIPLFLGTCALAGTLALMGGCAATGSSPSSSNIEETSNSGTISSAQASTSAGEADSDAFVEIGDTSAAASSSSDSAEKTAIARQLTNDITPIMESSGMDVGTCVIDLSTGARADINADKRMVAASMIKLTIAASLLEQVHAGALSLDDAYILQDSDIVGGAGSLGKRGAGAETTYREMLDLMISESDNTAANVIVTTIGMETVNKTAKELGLKNTEMNRLMMDEEAIAAGLENYVSAADVASILELAYNGKLVSPEASQILVNALENQTDTNGILGGLPSGVSFAHKTGWLNNAYLDGGIVDVHADGAMADASATTQDAGTLTEEGEDDTSEANANDDFIVVVLCGGNGYDLDGAHQTMASIGKTAYNDLVTNRAA